VSSTLFCQVYGQQLAVSKEHFCEMQNTAGSIKAEKILNN